MSEAKKLEHISEYISLDELTQKLFLNNFQIDNPELYSKISQIESEFQRNQEVKKIIDIGAFVKSKVEMVMDTDYLDLRVKKMTDTFDSGINNAQSQILSLVKENFDPNESKSYTSKINDFFESKKKEITDLFMVATKELNENKNSIKDTIDESFNPDLKTSYTSKILDVVTDFNSSLQNIFDFSKEGSISHQLKALLNDNLGSDGNFIKAIEKKLSFDIPGSTINQLQKNITTQFEDLKKELEIIKQGATLEKEANSKSIQKGYAFEDLVNSMLENFAATSGDIVEDVSKVAGAVTSSKKGDFIYEVKRLNKVIAIEAKNRNDIATPASLVKIMDKTKLNRKADYVIYIVADESQLHKQIDLLQEYDNDKIITHFGLLQVALKVAISRLQIENNELEGIDKSAVEQELSSITNSIKSFQAIKTAATNIRKEADKVTNQAEKIKIDISSSLSSLNNLLFSEGEN